MRRVKIIVAALVVLFVAGGVLWLVRGSQAPAKGDCDIAADMMDYRKNTGSEISSVKDWSDDMRDQNDPGEFILKKYDELQAGVPKFINQVRDPDIKARAQAVSDSDIPFIEWHRGLIAKPPDFSDSAWRASNDKKLREITDRITATSEALRQVCPNIKPYSQS